MNVGSCYGGGGVEGYCASMNNYGMASCTGIQILSCDSTGFVQMDCIDPHPNDNNVPQCSGSCVQHRYPIGQCVRTQGAGTCEACWVRHTCTTMKNSSTVVV